MSILGKDDFNRGPDTGLGGDWTEQGGGPVLSPTSDFDITAGGEATLGTGVGVFAATMNGTGTSGPVGVQAYINRGTIGTPTCGLCWRFVDTSNFYYAIVFNSGGTDALLVVRVSAGVSTTLANVLFDGVSSPFATTLRRMSVTMDASDRITIFVEGTYYTGFTTAGANTREGELWQGIDASPVAGSGTCGIITTASVSGSPGSMLWDNFLVTDLLPHTVYADVNAVAPTFGTVDSPDQTLGHATNNILAQRGTTVIDLNGAVTIGNGNPDGAFTEGDFTIGHAFKFAPQGGESFPTYNPLTGEVITPGQPILTFQSATSQRTVIRATRNDAFFLVRGGASFVMVRGFDFDNDPVGILSRLVTTGSANNVGAPTDHAFAVHKCVLRNDFATGQLVRLAHSMDTVDIQLCEFHADSDATRAEYAIQLGSTSGAQVRGGVIQYNTFHGFIGAPVRITGTIPLGDTLEVAHNHFVDIESAVMTTSCVRVDDGATILGTLLVRDNLAASRGVNSTDFGIEVTAGVVGGSIISKNNAWFGITTPRDTGVTDGGAELEGVDPAFRDEASSYSWPQTANSPAITLPSDWRPTGVGYVEMASDTFDGLTLDLGALQALMSSAPTRATSRDQEYCTGIVWDPDGAAVELTDLLTAGGDIVQEKDIELRQYKGGDVRLTFSDPTGMFLEDGANSIIMDPTGTFVDWPNKRVLVQYILRGKVVSEYLGFVLDVQVRRGEATIRIGNRLQELFQRQVRANNTGLLTNTAGETGLPFGGLELKQDGTPLGGNYLRFVSAVPTQGCGIGEWEFRFTTATDFEVFGKINGDGQHNGPDGTGNITTAFTSDSGAISVSSADWVGTFQPNDVVKVRTVYKAVSPTTVQVFKEMLGSASVANLDPDEFDSVTIDSFLGSFVDQPVTASRGYVIDQPTRVVDALRDICDHMLGTLIEKSRGIISLWIYTPRIDETFPIICKFTDLVEAGINYAAIYNEIALSYGYSEFTSDFTGTFSWPASDATNISLQRYGRRYRNPRPFELRAFTDANIAWMSTEAQLTYNRFQLPRRQATINATWDDLSIELDQIHTVDSMAPDLRLDMEPARIRKRVAPEPEVTINLADISYLTQIRACAKDDARFGLDDPSCQLF